MSSLTENMPSFCFTKKNKQTKITLNENICMYDSFLEPLGLGRPPVFVDRIKCIKEKMNVNSALCHFQQFISNMLAIIII